MNDILIHTLWESLRANLNEQLNSCDICRGQMIAIDLSKMQFKTTGIFTRNVCSVCNEQLNKGIRS